MAIRVFNADDHPMLRKGISDLIVETRDLEWVGSAENGTEALEKIRAIKPNIAVLDIEMPGLTGLQVAQALIEESSPTSIILLTLFKDGHFLRNALSIGVKGYLLKESSAKEIVDCIKSVHEGRAYVNPAMSQYLIAPPSVETDILSDLSDHEINILKLIAQQKTSSEIASMLFISPKTVSNHRSNISKKLGLSGEQNGLLKWAMSQKALL